MKKLNFDEIVDFCESVVNKFNSNLNHISIVAKYEEAREIIQEFVYAGKDIAYIGELASSEWSDYEDAFVISLLDDEIWCEPVKRETGYVYVECDTAFIFDNCNSKIISYIDSKEIYEVGIGDTECDVNCENCNCHKTDKETYTTLDDKGETHGFTVSKLNGNSHVSCSYYSTNKLSEEDIQKMLNILGF